MFKHPCRREREREEDGVGRGGTTLTSSLPPFLFVALSNCESLVHLSVFFLGESLDFFCYFFLSLPTKISTIFGLC